MTTIKHENNAAWYIKNATESLQVALRRPGLMNVECEAKTQYK